MQVRAHFEQKGHVSRRWQAASPRALRPRKAAVSLRIINIWSNGQKAIHLIARSTFRNGKLKRGRRRRGCVGAPQQSIAGIWLEHGVADRIGVRPEEAGRVSRSQRRTGE